MALNKNAEAGAAAPGATFEDPDGDTAVETKQVSAKERLAAAAAARAEAEQSASREVANKPAGAGAVSIARKMEDPFKPLENAFPVDWNTLRNLNINQGNVVDKDTDKPLGDEIGLELLSFQKQWVIGPGGEDKSDEAKALVRYSNDGVTSTQGDDMKTHLQHLKDTGYLKASMSERLVIVGSVFDIGAKGKKDLKDLQDALVQISLAPTSKATFDRYRMDQAYKIGRGLAQADGADRLRISCNLKKKTGSTETYTIANFSRYDAPAAE